MPLVELSFEMPAFGCLDYLSADQLLDEIARRTLGRSGAEGGAGVAAVYSRALYLQSIHLRSILAICAAVAPLF